MVVRVVLAASVAVALVRGSWEVCQWRRRRRPSDGLRRSSELGRASVGPSFPPPQSIRLRLRRRPGALPPTLSAGKYGFLDQVVAEVRSSGVGIDLGVSVNVIGFAKVLDDAGVTGNAEDLSFFDVDNVALSCGADSVAMLRRELMTAEPLLRARRARGILPHT